MTAKENVTEVGLSTDSHIECPYTTYKMLHSAGQAGFDPEIGLAVVGYDDLVSMSKNTEGFSSSISIDDQGPRHMGVGEEPVQDDVEQIFQDAHPMVNALFTADPPVHTRHRKLLSKALNPRRVRALEPHIRAIADDLVDKFIARDLDGDGDLDFLSTRGNSAPYDGVFWLEQVRTPAAVPAFQRAREIESAEMPLP